MVGLRYTSKRQIRKVAFTVLSAGCRRINGRMCMDTPEMDYFKQLIRNNAHLIIEFSQDGGVLNATTA